MKIGILTYHRTLNYGACLQAVATRIVLEKMGHEVYYVDYWPEYHRLNYSAFSFAKLKYMSFLGGLKYVIDSIRFYKYRKLRIENFDTFFQKFIYPYSKSIDESFDVIVYGSDQIWRKQGSLKSYNPVYFGKNDFKTSKHIAYSASMGVMPKSEGDIEKVKELVSHMDNIAVREKDLKLLLESLGYNDVTLTIDPTLLLTKEEWNQVLPEDTSACKGRYMLMYSIGKTSFDTNKVMSYAKSKGCELKILKGNADMADTDTMFTTVGPKSFVGLIKNAECVFTSSFHGLAFSIIYQKEFFASYGINSNRAETLLGIIGSKDRLLNPKADIPNLNPLDYDLVSKKLEEKKNASMNYLLNSLRESL